MAAPHSDAYLDELLDQALALAPAERDALVARVCAGDEVLRKRLLRLIALAERDDGFLDHSPTTAPSGARSPPAPPEAGDRPRTVGAYRLVRLLGAGGMGEVWLGDRIAGGFRQQAAIKLMRAGAAADRNRFDAERDILAGLNHPQIARLYDGGVTEDGQSYMAMEYVDGVDLLQWCRTRASSLRERIQLLLEVCRAVAYAHSQLVVHRDIKPANVLVTADGGVKLLDFGIARMLADNVVGDVTRTAHLSPAYAAPEQLTGERIGTAADVHALGVTLYELLTGVLPWPVQNLPLGAAVERLLYTQPKPPSEAAAEAAPVPAHALRGDLDAIVGKALRREPQERYPDARALAEDLERYLSARPVQARPPSLWYQARRFVRRHRSMVALTAVLLIALLGSLGVAAWQAFEARAQARLAQEQAALAQRQAARALEISGFVESLFLPMSLGIAVGEAPTVRTLLDRGRERIAQRYPDNAEVRADLLFMFARIDDTLGETTANRAPAEAAWRANEAAYGALDRRSLEARELYARVLRKVGDYDAAAAELEATHLALRSAGVAGQTLARILDGLTMVRRLRGDDPDAIVALQREALNLRLADANATYDDTATGWNNLGNAYLHAARFAEADEALERAYTTRLEHESDSLNLASILLNRAVLQYRTGQWRAAAERFGLARAMFARIPIERHPSLVNLVSFQCNLYGDLEWIDEARSSCRDAETLVLDVFGTHDQTYFLLLLRRANLALSRGDVEASRIDFAQARVLAGAAPLIGDPTTLLGTADIAQARLRWLTEDHAAQRDALLTLLFSPTGKGQLGTRTPGGFLLAALAARACRAAPSDACERDPLELANRLLTEPDAAHSVLRLPAQLALAEIKLADGQTEGAAAPIRTLLSELDQELPPGHSLRAQALLTLAALQGDTAAGRADAARGRELLAALPQGHPLQRYRWLLARVPRP